MKSEERAAAVKNKKWFRVRDVFSLPGIQGVYFNGKMHLSYDSRLYK
jgi:hypothetical protein